MNYTFLASLNSKAEKELAKFLPLLIGIVLGILLLSVIVLVVVKGRQSSGPLLQFRGQVIEKTPCGESVNRGLSYLVIQGDGGTRLRLLSNDVQQIVCLGDRGLFEYRSETLQRFIPDPSA